TSIQPVRLVPCAGCALEEAGRGRTSPPAAPLVAHPPAARTRILMVSPYHLAPADHGGAVRMYNLLRHLSKTCDVHLLIFSRAECDAAQRAALAPFARSVSFHRWHPVMEGSGTLQPRSVDLFDS